MDNNTTYYQRNREKILNKAKDYYENDKEKLREKARNKYRNLSEEDKKKKREQARDKYKNLSEEDKNKKREYGNVGETDRSSHRRCSVKKVVLRNFTKFTGKVCNFLKKESLAQVFSCEFCEISKNTFYTEHLQTTAPRLRFLMLQKRSI